MTTKNSPRDDTGRTDGKLSRRTALKRIATVCGIGATAAAAGTAFTDKAQAAYASFSGGGGTYSAYVSWTYSSH